MRSTPFLIALLLSASCANKEPGEALPDASSVTADSGDPNIPPPDDAGTNPMNMYTRLFITPENPTLTVINGVPASIDFELYGTDQTGTDQKITSTAVLWRTNDDRLGGFAEETRPHYTANGDRAGTAMIEAHFGSLNATTNVRVELSVQRTEGGAPNDAEQKFTAPRVDDPARAALVVYPANQTMIPKNLVPMELQWDAPLGIDLFRVTLKGPLASATVYTAARSVRLVKEEWSKLLESTAGSDLLLEVAGVNSAAPAEVLVGAPVNIRIADAQMRGTIYYWAVNVGRILRIRPGAESYEDFFTPPPGPDNSCVGCHTLSRDGSRMAFEYYGGWQTHGIIDVVSPNPPLIAPGVFQGNFSAFNPSGDRLLAAINGVLTLRDPLSGAAIEDVATGGLQATHPAWSPDGALIAYAAQLPGQGFADVDFFLSDLTLIRDASGARSAPEILVAADGQANAYPSFSPDSRHVAYMRGPYSRSHTAFDPAAPSAISPADIYIAATDRSSPPVRLDRASAAGQAFLPAYSPFSGGGVTWLAFFSRRDYGNVTKGSTRRQIWVTAISDGTAAGVDPSQPAFWLPAQDPSTENMSAYWAPDPCHGTGSTCVLDDDCCGGTLCRPDASGVRMCTPSAEACRELGELCADTSECCPGTNISCSPTQTGPRCAMTQL